jgi:hypothetical protein
MMTNRHFQCPGCGLLSNSADATLDEHLNASGACRALMHELTYYTLALADPYFIHQVAVDAYAAQHVGPQVKPISTAFALAGLYLVFERDFTGRQVQRVHMEMARRQKEWPRFERPAERRVMTVRDVVLSPDSDKQAAIRAWAQQVWSLWKREEDRIAALLQSRLGLT